MMKRALVVIVTLPLAAPLHAQAPARLAAPAPLLAERSVATAGAVQEETRGWTPLRVAKWATLGGAAGAAIYGFVKSGEADEAYDALERACEADPVMCRRREVDGAYTDPALEQRYREVQRLDDRASTALVAGQIALAASVVLFLLDLGDDARPPDIPYTPPRLRLEPARDGIELGVRLPLGRQPTS